MTLIEQYIDPGLVLLPPKMTTAKSRAMLAAAGLQESGFKYRKQINGPARSFWQFEKGGGVAGVLSHPRTKDIIREVCKTLYVPPDVDLCYGLIAYHDVLACCFARLLLWTSPLDLPGADEVQKGWEIYYSLWRPGKPRPEEWPGNFKRAWGMVQ
ncbi:MAG: hypothetical protein PHZ19_12295 [Candidatus Thermoplasmatota archaeon]|nr:hypothetical protein [Candidatus Thermoplasmatota archaeon]